MGGYGDVAGVRYCFSGSSGVCPGNTPVCGTGEDRVFGSGDWGRGNKGRERTTRRDTIMGMAGSIKKKRGYGHWPMNQ